MNNDDPYVKYLKKKQYTSEWIRQDRAFNYEQYAQRNREYYQAHKDEIIAKRRLYYLKNKDFISAQKREYYKTRDDEWRERRKKRLRERYAKNLI